MVKLSYVNSAVTGAPVLATELHRAPGNSNRLAIYAHGLASTRGGDKPQFFKERLPALGWDFAAFDFQGHGESTGDLRGLTLSRQIEDLAAVVEAHGPLYERVVLIGSSMGGWTAAWYAARHPGKVHACVLIAPAFGFVEGLQRWIGEAETRRWRDEGSYTFQGPEGPFKLDYGINEDRRLYPDEELYAAYRTPTLVLHGMEDETVPWKASTGFADKAKNAEVDVILFGAGDHRLGAYKDAMLDHMRAWWERTA